MPASTKAAIISLCGSGGIEIEKYLSQQGNDGCIWLRLIDAATFAHVAPCTVRRWCRQGLVKWRKLNLARCGRILIDRASLHEFIESRVGGGNS